MSCSLAKSVSHFKLQTSTNANNLVFSGSLTKINTFGTRVRSAPTTLSLSKAYASALQREYLR